MVSSVLHVVPDKMLVRLKYASNATINATTDTSAIAAFRANDLYDPDFSGVGNQPTGFDQLCTLYSRFCVLSSKCTAYGCIDTVSNITPCWIGIGVTRTGSRLTGLTTQEVFGMPECSTPHIGGNVQAMAMQGPLTKRFSAPEFFGKKVLDNDFECTSAASPARCGYFEVVCCSVNGNDPAVQPILVVIDYEVECRVPVELGLS